MLEIKQIHSGYGNFQVLFGVDIRIEKYEIVAMIGPNGAGKSTVLRTIFGFLKPLRGSVIFQGKDITNLKPINVLKEGISYVLQRHSIFPTMSIKENLEMGGFLIDDKEEINKKIQNLCEMFPFFKERYDQPTSKLSGGERRMVEIARGLMLDPKLLMLDEPTLGLAPKIQKVIFNKIHEINEEHELSFLIVEQNARLALEHSHRAYVLENGKTIMEGSGTEILHDPKVVKAYLGGREKS
ncbi:MAG: ABC transporter ATP-binding protein [Methanomicrobia archaeon]|nr:ABC transporter ATP-binding protein [Methanomicrobia archaeon]